MGAPWQNQRPRTPQAPEQLLRNKQEWRAGGPGESPVAIFNIHLPLSPSANSPLGRRGTRMPGGFPPLSTGESGLPVAGKTKWQEVRPPLRLWCRAAPAISLSHRTASADSSLPEGAQAGAAAAALSRTSPVAKVRTPPPQKPRSGCRSTRKEAMRRICRGSLPLQAEIQATLCNPSRPGSQPRDQLTRTARGSGGIACCDSLGGFPPISPGESGLPAAGKTKWQEVRTPLRPWRRAAPAISHSHRTASADSSLPEEAQAGLRHARCLA